MGGNLLQRTRCNYFRDTGFAACNKRTPGSGCAALAGDRRDFAVFGTSDHCIALHASDMAVAMIALGAVLSLRASDGSTRFVKLDDFYRPPGATPHLETVLRPGELIVRISVPASAAARRSGYLKVRDRSSFAFALCSAAVGLEIDGGTIRDARIAMGGVGTVPWRLPAVEAALRGQSAQPASFARAALELQPTAGAPAHFKFDLARRVLTRALQTIAA